MTSSVDLKKQDLTEALSDLLGTKSADSIEAKTEDDTVFLSESDVEGVVLQRDSTAVPAISHRDRRTDERSISLSRSFLEVEKE